ncbi:MAG: hypothetical protein AAFV37_05775 [Pseudomonadota bacterium]
MQQEILDRSELSQPDETSASEQSGVIALILGAISGGAMVGLIWLFSTLLT